MCIYNDSSHTDFDGDMSEFMQTDELAKVELMGAGWISCGLEK
jgi:hypothetical protein